MGIEAVYNTKTPAEELNHFEEIADEYERTVKALNYTGPQLCIQALKKCEEKTGISVPRNGKCIDIGAGTGMSGESLRSAGFTGVVDALEPSDNMYSIAAQKGIYSTRYSDMLSPDKETSVESSAYDLVLSCGVFSNRSASSGCLPEVIRMAKMGGVITIVMNNDFWKDGFDSAVEKLEEQKRVQVMYNDSFEGFFGDKTARVFILQKL
ncbi:uncharacterized protein LOC142351503 [Convolutriloba macropyga]|uniref:uncharacterized protein LOC142351503 n=1 Tax=Convolutriloba macropyga TaxID=536237 RepID=UPI003F52379D